MFWRDSSVLFLGEEGSGEEAAEESELVEAEEGGEESGDEAEGEDGESGEDTKDATKKGGCIIQNTLCPWSGRGGGAEMVSWIWNGNSTGTPQQKKTKWMSGKRYENVKKNKICHKRCKCLKKSIHYILSTKNIIKHDIYVIFLLQLIKLWENLSKRVII